MHFQIKILETNTVHFPSMSLIQRLFTHYCVVLCGGHPTASLGGSQVMTLGQDWAKPCAYVSNPGMH